MLVRYCLQEVYHIIFLIFVAEITAIRVASSKIFNNYCRNYGNVFRKGVVSGYLINDKLLVSTKLRDN